MIVERQPMPAMRRFTAARLTPAGRGAVATIRVCGELGGGVVGEEAIPERGRSGDVSGGRGADLVHSLNLLFHAANGISLSDQLLKKIVFGRWGAADGEDLVVCRHTTDILEIHCHGGEAAVQRILADLDSAGCVVVDWRKPSALSLSENLFDAECREILSQTSTWRTTKIVLEQTNGLLKASFKQLMTIGSSDEQRFNERVDDLLAWAHFGEHLSTPWSVVLTGRPNVGKSSLINALLGYQRAIVFDQPGTTRDVVTGETAFDGWPVVLADTAGIRDNAGDLEAAGIALARNRLRSADLRIVLIDRSQPPTEDDERLLLEWPNSLVVGHKSDLTDCWGGSVPEQAIPVSSVTGQGLEELQKRLILRLIPTVPKLGTPIPISVRQTDRLREARDSNNIETRQRALQALFDG